MLYALFVKSNFYETSCFLFELASGTYLIWFKIGGNITHCSNFVIKLENFILSSIPISVDYIKGINSEFLIREITSELTKPIPHFLFWELTVKR